MTLTAAVTDERDALVLTAADGSVIARLAADEVEQLIATLAAGRRQMAPEVDRDVRALARPPAALLDPHWALGPGPQDTRLLYVRDPGLGWLGFAFKLEDAGKLAAHLQGA